MQVFNYPENLLLPTLCRNLKDQSQNLSQLFEENLVKPLSPGGGSDSYRPLSPQYARELASNYLKAASKELHGLAGTSFQLTDQLSYAELAGRRKLVDDWPGSRATRLPTSAMQYLHEIFYTVPVYLALQLQQMGEYAAAVDWLHSVYAYDLPADQRKVYGPLNLEQSTHTDYQHDAFWLKGALNPHEIVSKRANGYTRFTILSLVRCLLEYGDAEFTNDTDESLPRARAMYMSVLDMLDLPEMEPDVTADAPPPNLLLWAVRLHAENNLLKLRRGRNIAGMQRQVETSPAPSPAATALVIGSNGQIQPPPAVPVASDSLLLLGPDRASQAPRDAGTADGSGLPGRPGKDRRRKLQPVQGPPGPAPDHGQPHAARPTGQ